VTENPTIWISNKGSFGLNWNIETIKVYAPENGNNNSDGGSGAVPVIPTGELLIADSDSED
jgi:hypothetical protein